MDSYTPKHHNTDTHSPFGQHDLLESPAYAAPEYAGFWIRVAASLLDSLIIIVIGFVIVLPVIMINESLLSAMSFVLYPAYFLYYPIMESSRHQATFGKKAVGLMVTNESLEPISFMTALGRNLGKILSALILYIGYIMVAFTEKRQGLHDIISHTLVIKK